MMDPTRSPGDYQVGSDEAIRQARDPHD